MDDRSHVTRRRAGGSSGRTGAFLGPVRVTPIRLVLVIALLGSIGYIAYAILMVDDLAQIPMVTSGAAVLGLAFTAVSVGAAVRMVRAWQDGGQGRTLVFAVLGGITGVIALGCFAGALILALVWSG
ncbi:MAG: hypothetical protein HW391_27 [Chloroflexi bacterium]|nr:hypothetical protein [Chloroflexota bacterium]